MIGIVTIVKQTKFHKSSIRFDPIFCLTLIPGVADGVGGWRNYGIDPGEFSSFLMKTCERLVCSGRLKSVLPATLLARSYYELLESKRPILGMKIQSHFASILLNM